MESKPPISNGTWKRIEAMRDAAQKSTYSYEQIGFLSNNIGPRLSGSPQAAAAVEYVAKQMRDLGLDVRLEPVKLCCASGTMGASLRLRGSIPQRRSCSSCRERSGSRARALGWIKRIPSGSYRAHEVQGWNPSYSGRSCAWRRRRSDLRPRETR
jgi:hypothetical protein